MTRKPILRTTVRVRKPTKATKIEIRLDCGHRFPLRDSGEVPTICLECGKVWIRCWVEVG